MGDNTAGGGTGDEFNLLWWVAIHCLIDGLETGQLVSVTLCINRY